MLDFLPKPVVFAHRGASKYAPENTLSSFHLAVDQGADAIELDVQLTADNQVVVFHDSHLDRTTNGAGLLKEHKLASLQKLNAGKLFGSEYDDVKIPALYQVFDIFGTSTFFNIELKNLLTPYDNLPVHVINLIQEYQLEDYVLISSFNPIALFKVEKIAPNLPKGLLIKGKLPLNLHRILILPFIRYKSVHFSFDTISSKQVQSIHSGGKLAFTYTINNPDEILTSLQDGVDGFFTDDPSLARKTLSMSKSERNQ
jgi:glycerophosphoryl diester phosphodiesterase